MAQNASNQDFTNSSDGFVLGGGTTERKLTVTGGDITMTGSGSNTYSFPGSSDTLLGASSLPSGVIWAFAAVTAPTGWLLCDGSAVSRTTYASLFSAIAPSKGTFTVTIASPAVVTLNSHGMSTGDATYLTTTGALPTGLSANTLYYVIKVNANTFNLATSRANALAGTKINTSGSQSGTHTLVFCPYGLGDGSTTFNVPNLSGNVGVGSSSGDANFGNLGQAGGSASHSHPLSGNGGAAYSATTNQFNEQRTTAPGSWTPTNQHNGTWNNAAGSGTQTVSVSLLGNTDSLTALPPYVTINYIIKT